MTSVLFNSDLPKPQARIFITFSSGGRWSCLQIYKLKSNKNKSIQFFQRSDACLPHELAGILCLFLRLVCLCAADAVIAGEFNLTKAQIANINIAAVAITILVRLIVGPLCDKYGPRKTYSALLIIGSIPVFGVAALIATNPSCSSAY